MTELLRFSAVASGVVPRRQRPRRRTPRFLVLLVALVILGNAIVGERGLIALYRANHEFETVSVLIETLRMENTGLREQARKLREEPQAIEDLARGELGLIRPGETVFILSDVPRLTLPPALPSSRVVP